MSVWITALGSLLSATQIGVNTAAVSAAPAASRSRELWRDQGKDHKALELLAPIYHWFTEGHATRDMKEAKALLETLT